MNFELGNIVVTLAGLFLIIGVSYIATKFKILSISASTTLSNLLMRIAFPCTMFVSMIRPFDPNFLTDGIIVIVITTILLFVFIALALFISKVTKIKPGNRGAFIMCGVFCNAGFIGYPIALSLMGSEGLSLAVILNLPLMVITLGIGCYLIQRDSLGNEKTKVNVKRLIFSEANILMVLGVIFYFKQWSVPEIIMTPLTYLSDLTTPLSLVVVGITLASAEVGSMLKDREVLIPAFLRLILFPSITYAFLSLFNFANPLVPAVILVLLATPSPGSGAALTQSNGGNAPLAAKITFLTSILSMVTLVFWILLI